MPGGVAGYERRVWRRIAWICRYGNVPLSEVLHMDTRAGLIFADELQAIVERENRPRGG